MTLLLYSIVRSVLELTPQYRWGVPIWARTYIFAISWNIPQEKCRLEYSNYKLHKQTYKHPTRIKYKIFKGPGSLYLLTMHVFSTWGDSSDSPDKMKQQEQLFSTLRLFIIRSKEKTVSSLTKIQTTKSLPDSNCNPQWAWVPKRRCWKITRQSVILRLPAIKTWSQKSRGACQGKVEYFCLKFNMPTFLFKVHFSEFLFFENYQYPKIHQQQIWKIVKRITQHSITFEVLLLSCHPLATANFALPCLCSG